MGEEFYCVLKLVSGEEIFSLVSTDEDENGEVIIILQNPVVMKSFNNSRGVYVKVKSWIELSDDDFFIINLSSVITMTESKEEKLINIYNNFISDASEGEDSIEVYNPNGGKVGVSKEMGYVSSVEESRKNLEKIFNDLKES
jgi:hypothetical protein